MEVKLHKTIPGCLYLLCTICTMGGFILLMKYSESVFPKTLDDQGLTTRGGTRIAWSEFTRIQKITTKGSGGGIMAVEFWLYAGKKKVSIHMGRVVDSKKVFDYAYSRLPAAVKQA